jgi:hypothetical protein
MFAGIACRTREPQDCRILGLENFHLLYEGLCHEKLLKITFHWKIIGIPNSQVIRGLEQSGSGVSEKMKLYIGESGVIPAIWGIPATLELVKLVVEVIGKNTSQLRQRDFRPHASFQCPKLFCYLFIEY